MIEKNWREIQLQWDIFNDKKARLFTAAKITAENDINHYRFLMVPDAITSYTQIKSDIEKIESSDPIIIENKENLMVICNYKIILLTASSEYYHATELVKIDREMAIDDYRNAKYAYQDALGILNSFDEE
jgi:hypothetical protein